MVVAGFALVGATGPAVVREAEGDLWDIEDEEARTISEPAARILSRIPPQHAALIEGAIDPVILLLALKFSVGERLAQRQRIYNAIRQAGQRGHIQVNPAANGYAQPGTEPGSGDHGDRAGGNGGGDPWESVTGTNRAGF